MDVSTPVSKHLSLLKINHRLYQHPGPIHSLEQAAQERGQRLEQVVRSIVFRIGQGEYVMVLISGPEQVSWPALRIYLGKSRLTMATPDEVREATGYETGAVSPFGLPGPMRILIDEALLTQEEISIGSGVRGVTVILQRNDLLAGLPEAEIGKFSSSQPGYDR